MTIDKDKLVNLLVVKTGMDEEKVRDQLSQLVSHIQQAAEEGKTFEIEGFGTFSMQDDTLHFEPDNTLQTEINHKYTGMEPIELIGAFKEIPEGEVEEVEKPEEPDELVEEDTVKSKFRFDEDQEIEDAEEDDQPIPAGESKPAFELDMGEEEEQAPDEEPATEPEKEPVPVTSRKAEKDNIKEEEEADPIGKVLVAFAIVLAIGVSGWIAYEMDFLESITGTSKIVTADSPASDVDKEKENNSRPSQLQNTTDKSSTPEQKEDNSVSLNTQIAEESRSSIYGLRGGAVPQASDGYTIVVHSLRNESRAKNISREFQSDGYITVLLKARVKGSTYWRVGLGQFKTIAEAKTSIAELPGPYRNDNFIRKIE